MPRSHGDFSEPINLPGKLPVDETHGFASAKNDVPGRNVTVTDDVRLADLADKPILPESIFGRAE